MTDLNNFLPSSNDYVDVLVSDYNAEAKQLSEDIANLIRIDNSFLGSYGSLHGIYLGKLRDSEGIQKGLVHSYWRKVYDRSNIAFFLNSDAKKKWNKDLQIDSDASLPDFTEANILSTLESWFSQSRSFFIDRVDHVFNKLSPEHVTNSPKGFGGKLIFKNYTYFVNKTVSINDKDLMHDLRSIIAVALGRNVPSYDYNLFSGLNYGEWISFDDDAFKMKCFKNSNVHIVVSEEVAFALNSWLAEKYPSAIPSQYKAIPKAQPKAHTYTNASASNTVHDFNRALNSYPDMAMGRNVKADEEISHLIGLDKTEYQALIKDNDSFNCLKDAVNHYCRNGVPDVKSFQYYPTPKPITDFIRDYLSAVDVDENLTVLEPSAGTGALASIFPKNTHAIEISKAFCKVLEAKKIAVVSNLDFMLATATPSYDYVLMNPPFSENRCFDHLKHAMDFVKKGGELILIAPTGYKDKIQAICIDKGFKCYRLRSFGNVFKDTAIETSVYSIKQS